MKKVMSKTDKATIIAFSISVAADIALGRFTVSSCFLLATAIILAIDAIR